MLTNPVVISIIVLLALSLLRINVVIALIISALVAGLTSSLNLTDTIQVFTNGLGGGAEVAMNYAILGAFAIAISKSGITDLLAYKVIKRLGNSPTGRSMAGFKYLILAVLVLFSISSQNLIPVHIAFIPIVIPPLLSIFNKLKLDRRAVACVLTFGLTATYMLLPVGFGKIFIESILVKNINQVGATLGLQTSVTQVSLAMSVPVIGMIIGLLTAIFITYRKPREYVVTMAEPTTAEIEKHIAN
ncbi:MAG TPA: sodium:proton antiporter, partial [Pasteurellaceae bacterium]|nr:sodium:proton antiporter [Pasteurellaceae bacterium]